MCADSTKHTEKLIFKTINRNPNCISTMQLGHPVIKGGSTTHDWMLVPKIFFITKTSIYNNKKEGD